MIEILRQYWQSYLWTDGLQMTGVAMTAWLLVLSIGIGFVLAVPLSLARVSENIWLRGPVWLFTYVFRGTPLYIQLLIIYSGIYSFDYIHEHQTLDAFFREGINCTILAFALNTGAYTTEIFTEQFVLFHMVRLKLPKLLVCQNGNSTHVLSFRRCYAVLYRFTEMKSF